MITPGQSHWIPNESIELHVEEVGHGPQLILFVHGWISSRRMWWDVAHQFDPTRYTLFLLDLRGSGLSDRPQTGHDLAGYVSDVHATLEWIGRPTALVGHSAGGKIAQAVALESGDISALCLVAPGVAKGYPVNELHRKRTIETYGFRKRIETFQQAVMSVKVNESVSQRMIDDSLLSQWEAWMGWYNHGRPADFAHRLSEIRVPTLAIAGENDPLVPRGLVQREVVNKINQAQYAEIKGVGHNIPIEAPMELAKLIKEFI